MALASLSKGVVCPAIEFFINGMQTSSRLLFALFSLSLSPGYIFIVHPYSAHHLLRIPCHSHPSKPESDSFPLALFAPVALTSLDFHVSVSAWFSNVAHLSLVNVVVGKQGKEVNGEQLVT